jgi:hypothetical protein
MLLGRDLDLSLSIGAVFVRSFLGTATRLLGLDLDISGSDLVLGSALAGTTTATLLVRIGLVLNDGRISDGLIIISSFLSTGLLLLGGLLFRILGIGQTMLLARRGLLSVLGLGVRLVSHMTCGYKMESTNLLGLGLASLDTHADVSGAVALNIL